MTSLRNFARDSRYKDAASMSRRAQRTGFSLVELLIVLVIILLLVAIVLPAVNRAREMARRSLCVSHIGQLTAAWLAYAGDNDGHLPNKFGSPAWDGALTQEQLASEGPQALWNWHDPATTIPRGQLWPYLRNLKTYTCPDDPQEFHWVTYAFRNLPGQTVASGGTGTSYGVNPLLGDAGNPFPTLPLHTAWGKKPHTVYEYYHASLLSRIVSGSYLRFYRGYRLGRSGISFCAHLSRSSFHKRAERQAPSECVGKNRRMQHLVRRRPRDLLELRDGGRRPGR